MNHVTDSQVSPDYRRLNPVTPFQRVSENALKSISLRIENKTFDIALKENSKGRFLRITETGKTARRNNIIIPGSGLDDFKILLDQMSKLAAEMGAASKT